MHRLLKRQIKKSFAVKSFQELPDDITKFINLVEKTYESFDIDKKVLEHTIKVNTEELNKFNRELELDGELRLKDLIEQVPYGIIIIDYQGHIIDINQFACRVLGYERSDFMELTAFKLFDKFSKYSFVEIKNSVLEDKNLSFDDGFENYVGLRLPVEIATGKLVIKNSSHVLIMFQDIIERVQAENMELERRKEIEELNRSLEVRVQEEVLKNLEKDQLLIQQSKMAAMGDMMGNIAHQWRQPLNTLAISIQDIEEAFLFDDLNEEYISNFTKLSMDNIAYMSKTIDDFRNFFKPSKRKEVFKIKLSIEDILQIVETQLKNNNIDITLKGDDYKVIGYPNEFKQVIINLTNNAKDAILDNQLQNGRIEIEIEKYSDEFIKITVKDNGGGVPIDILNKVFEPYFTTKEGNKGTGIGLYMSKTIIEENMKGKLILENIENGAEFSILLPSSKDEVLK